MKTVVPEEVTEFFRDSFKPRATRFEPCRNDACLTWRESGSSLESETINADNPVAPDAEHLFALLIDISQTGASIALDRVPQAAEHVWLRLEGDGHPDWAEAQVVGVTTTSRGPHLVRLAFRNPCPDETLLATICG
jgi:hypothetical protein